jgi:Cu/Ag efflux protein CusF
LGWPEMIMYFKVSPDVDLSGFKGDEKVEFELQEDEDGYSIKTMKKAE